MQLCLLLGLMYNNMKLCYRGNAGAEDVGAGHQRQPGAGGTLRLPPLPPPLHPHPLQLQVQYEYVS